MVQIANISLFIAILLPVFCMVEVLNPLLRAVPCSIQQNRNISFLARNCLDIACYEIENDHNLFQQIFSFSRHFTVNKLLKNVLRVV